jgi:tetratricopeptide (TPR) repeat protein
LRFSEQIQQGLNYQKAGKPKEADRVFREVLAKDSGHYQANYALGMLYHQHERNDLAIPLIAKSVELRPDIFAGLLNLGMIQRDEGLLADSRINLEKAIRLQPDHAEAHVTLGLLLMDLAELDQALKEMEEGLRLEPGNHLSYARMGMLQQIRGETDAAAACYRKVIELTPANGTAHRSLAFLQKQSTYNDDIRKMEDRFNAPDTTHKDKMLIGNALGKVFDDLGEYDKAFDYLQTTNLLQRQSFDYSIDNQKAFFNRHRQGLDKDFLKHCQHHAVSDNTPVFVVGMPRSGTSLVEQILASHPLVHGAGEVEYSRLIVEAVQQKTQKPFPEDISRVSPETLNQAARAYIEKLALNSGTAERVVDKLPHNFLRIGLFAALMPDAKIILCEREPMDNCLSIYQHMFGPAHAYASDLSDLGHYYRLYQDLMSWWDEILPGHIYRVNYEQLVSDTENQVRQLLDHCELPFDENCLSFHKTRRQVRTPSAAQVQQPIYKGSKGRWKNYQKHLGPLRVALDSN